MAKPTRSGGAESRTVFVCQECGYESTKWLGRCPGCSAWNSLVEERMGGLRGGAAEGGPHPAPDAVPIADVALDDAVRRRTGLAEVDRVLGGGVVPGSLVLIGGDPGVGKSTLALAVAQHVAVSSPDSAGPRGRADGTPSSPEREPGGPDADRDSRPVLYVSGEESVRQTKMRAARLGIDAPNLLVLAETDLDQIVIQVDRIRPSLVVIDSIQTVYRADITAAPGSVAQIRECTGDLLRIAKTDGGPAVLVIGHVTKEGAIAGPRVLEHMVDTVLYFEGERHHAYRVLRATKNRFGSTNEIGVFAMSGRGLTEVADPSALFLAERPAGASGSAVVCAMEGTRPLLLEVQGLVTRTPFGMPRRTAAGVDYNRLLLLLAVLEKRAGLHLSAHDVYVSVAGGVRVDEPAADLGMALAVASSHRDRPVDAGAVAVGEVGLGGEVRAVSQIDRRIAEAAKLGFRRVVAPRANLAGLDEVPAGVELTGVDHVAEALERFVT
ncbi:MAG TPA: DNA repair protein RadA [bacterium]|nr:DNA repair protein RadA [bacterium]